MVVRGKRDAAELERQIRTRGASILASRWLCSVHDHFGVWNHVGRHNSSILQVIIVKVDRDKLKSRCFQARRFVFIALPQLEAHTNLRLMITMISRCNWVVNSSHQVQVDGHGTRSAIITMNIEPKA